MRSRIVMIVVITLSLFGCNNGSNGTDNNSEAEKDLITQKTEEDDLKLANEKQVELEMLKLKKQGVFGVWECSFSGYESIISLSKEEGVYISKIDFTNNNSENKYEALQKKGEKYFVIKSTAKEYYIINKTGDLEMWDNVGLFTIARNVMPNVIVKQLPEYEIEKTIGQDVFFVRGNYSKSSPETLEGTNNDYWIVYYEDINTTFKVSKKTFKIENAVLGKSSAIN